MIVVGSPLVSMAAAAAAAAVKLHPIGARQALLSASTRRSPLASRYNASGKLTAPPSVENPQNRRNLSTTTDLGLHGDCARRLSPINIRGRRRTHRQVSG